ncbi:DNA-binding transcriptional regulator, XRE-family HTH domain [Methylobacterium sp. UNC300MFChir4.1]|nr:DNA-binding transcriptional regulator, XRE-family HTH domain [Methylobacterium sp. UNC300MFChir4.1]
MSKSFVGVRLRRLREERGLTQTALARALSISNSYLSQIEQNQRPLTVPLLLKLNATFGLDVQLFSENEEGRLLERFRFGLSRVGRVHAALGG